MEVVNELKDYAKYHFEHEEEYMNEKKFRKYLSHKVAHDGFIEKINEYDAEIVDENQKESLLELLDFLTSWLVEHILKQDKLYAE
jgi:hemerythrin